MVRPGTISWVAETDQGDPLPNGPPGPGGEVVGWAIWIRDGSSPVAKNWQRAGEEWESRIERALLQMQDKYYEFIGLDPTNKRGALARLLSVLSEPFDPQIFEESWHVDGLYVAPAYHRRGIAKIMLKWGLDQATAEKVPATVNASPVGFKVYEQVGFRSIERVDFSSVEPDFDPGEPGLHRLVWEPSGMEGHFYDPAKKKVEERRKVKKR